MCFSATASFIAGASLCVLGMATLKITTKRSEWPFAMIPLLFGVQQLTEGLLWMTFRQDMPLVRQATTYLYSGFSYLLWAMYVPFATGSLETVLWRKRVIYAFQAIGVSLSLYMLYFITTHSVIAEVVGRHIVYDSPDFHKLPMMALYLVATCGTCFFSSHAFIKLFGLLALISFFAAYLVSALALFSIWCFMVAILSLVIYFHFRFDHPSNKQGNPHFLGLFQNKTLKTPESQLR